MNFLPRWHVSLPGAYSVVIVSSIATVVIGRVRHVKLNRNRRLILHFNASSELFRSPHTSSDDFSCVMLAVHFPLSNSTFRCSN